MVLIVDDDESIRESLREILEDEGYEVATAADGREALAFLASELPCIMLLDLMMPNVDGWEVMGRLQDDARLSTVPVCVVSATPDLALANATAVMGKPIELDRLLDLVGERCRSAAHS